MESAKYVFTVRIYREGRRFGLHVSRDERRVVGAHTQQITLENKSARETSCELVILWRGGDKEAVI